MNYDAQAKIPGEIFSHCSLSKKALSGANLLAGGHPEGLPGFKCSYPALPRNRRARRRILFRVEGKAGRSSPLAMLFVRHIPASTRAGFVDLLPGGAQWQWRSASVEGGTLPEQGTKIGAAGNRNNTGCFRNHSSTPCSRGRGSQREGINDNCAARR